MSKMNMNAAVFLKWVNYEKAKKPKSGKKYLQTTDSSKLIEKYTLFCNEDQEEPRDGSLDIPTVSQLLSGSFVTAAQIKNIAISNIKAFKGGALMLPTLKTLKDSEHLGINLARQHDQNKACFNSHSAVVNGTATSSGVSVRSALTDERIYQMVAANVVARLVNDKLDNAANIKSEFLPYFYLKQEISATQMKNWVLSNPLYIKAKEKLVTRLEKHVAERWDAKDFLETIHGNGMTKGQEGYIPSTFTKPQGRLVDRQGAQVRIPPTVGYVHQKELEHKAHMMAKEYVAAQTKADEAYRATLIEEAQLRKEKNRVAKGLPPMKESSSEAVSSKDFTPPLRKATRGRSDDFLPAKKRGDGNRSRSVSVETRLKKTADEDFETLENNDGDDDE